MFWQSWSRFPRKMAVLLAAATLLPLGTLIWFGWLVLKQDRVLEEEQIRQRVDRAADTTVAALEEAIAATEKRLIEDFDDWPEGSVAVTFDRDRIRVRPAGRVAYVPFAPGLPEPPEAIFAPGERLEFLQRDLAGAAAFYRKLIGNRDPLTRAGALLRFARSLRALGQRGAALEAYAGLLNTDNVAFSGVPASLVARHSRCVLMEQENQTTVLDAEAQELGADLRRGRWELTRPVLRLYQQDLPHWGVTVSTEPDRELLAEALTTFWESGNGSSQLPGSGRELIEREAGEVVACWVRSDSRMSVFLATGRFVEKEWLTPLGPLLQDWGVEVALLSEGSSVAGSVIRRAGDTGLPWSIRIASVQPPLEQSQYEFRRQLLVAGFALLVLLALLASYLIFRAVSREAALARLQTEFVAAVSHEFRTPLTSLHQFTGMLRDHRNLSEERRELCYEAQYRATARLTRLVESLLDFGRMEEGARIYDFRPLDCGDLAERVVDEFRCEPAALGFEIRVSRNGSAAISADREALERAIWNLLDNAAKYSGESRQIDVEVDRRGGDVAISVRDRGIGISPAEQPAVFQKFSRGREALRLGIKGTGIGLAMVEHIVKAHGGHVELASEPGVGSSFRLILPVRE